MTTYMGNNPRLFTTRAGNMEEVSSKHDRQPCNTTTYTGNNLRLPTLKVGNKMDNLILSIDNDGIRQRGMSTQMQMAVTYKGINLGCTSTRKEHLSSIPS